MYDFGFFAQKLINTDFARSVSSYEPTLNN